MPSLRLIAALLVCSCNAFAGQVPASYDAIYDLSRGMFRLGTMERRLEVGADGNYVFESRMQTRGLVALLREDRVVETSRGRIEGRRFVPERYEYVRTGGKRDFALHFDYASGVVRRADQNGDWSAEMPQYLLDKLVYQAQLMIDLVQTPDAIDYDIADKSKLKKYVIRNLGSEEVMTEAGRFQTVRLERVKADSKRRTTVWCAAELAWLPVKVEYQEKDGSVTTAALRSVRQR